MHALHSKVVIVTQSYALAALCYVYANMTRKLLQYHGYLKKIIGVVLPSLTKFDGLYIHIHVLPDEFYAVSLLLYVHSTERDCMNQAHTYS